MVGEIVNDSPLQIVADWSGTYGLGLTVSVNLNVAPVQFANFGVTVYSILFATLVVLTSACVKLAWLVDASVWPVISELLDVIDQV